MNRRALLATVAGAVPLAGCSTTDDPGDGNGTPTTTPPSEPAAEGSVAHRLDMLEYTRNSHGPLDDPPEISFDPDEDRVVVTGAMRYGSSSCDEIAVADVAWRGGELRVAVEAGTMDAPPTTCTSDLDASRYRLVLDFEDGYPDSVSVVEVDAEGSERTRTASAPSS